MRKERKKKRKKGKETEEREREREMKKSYSFSLRSKEFRPSEFVWPRMEVNLLNKSYAWVPKPWDFAEDSSKELGKSKVSSLGSVHGTS